MRDYLKEIIMSFKEASKKDFILNLKPYFRLSKVVDPNDVNKFSELTFMIS